MNSLQQPLNPLTQLSNIFPDIQGQLCSRHSTLFGKLRTTFNKLYDSLEPQAYVVLKGSAKIFNCGEQASLQMGLQNGLIVMVKKTYLNSKIYINGNHIDEQVILSLDGEENEGFHPQIDSMRKCLKASVQNLNPNQLYGGIVYIHGNIPQQSFQYHNILLIGIYIAFLIINSQLNSYKVSDIIDSIVKCNIGINQKTLMRNFIYYQNRRFYLKVGESSLGIMLEDKAKMIVCKFDVAIEDKQHQSSMSQKIKIQKDYILNELKDKYNINSIEQLISNSPNLSTIQLSQYPLQETKLSNDKLLEILAHQMSVLCEFSNNKIAIKDLLRIKWEIDSQHWKIYSEEVVELVQNIKQQLNLESCCVINCQYILIATDKFSYTDLLCKLRKKMNKGQMKSKSLFKIEDQLIQNRWESDMKIGEKMFTCVPSKGVAVFDPKDAIWFDEI